MKTRNVPAWMLLAVAFGSAPQAVRGQAAPQRTITSNPSSTAVAGAQPDAIDAMLRQYREMWAKMGPAQQKAFLDSGGSTPEQYERTLRAKGLPQAPARAVSATPPGRQTPADPRAATDALDSLTTSLQDLNAIRDGNLTRVQKDGCPPEVSSRLADLKGKLHQYEAELTGAEAPASAQQPKERRGAADAQAIADDWYKKPQQEKSEQPASGNQEGKLLTDVLPAAPANAVPEHRSEPKSPEALQKQKDLAGEIARLKAEIQQLSGACTELKK